MERAGFIDAPQIGPANIASSSTNEPIAIPAMTPFSFEPVETLMITSMRKKVRMSSRKNDCVAEPEGIVAPRVKWPGNNAFKVPLANNAPINWLMAYGNTSFPGNLPENQKAMVTAGLM